MALTSIHLIINLFSNCNLWAVKLGRARALECHILETSQVYSYGHEVT
jgi:hypothetical protein